jgi:hypothetical protein
MAEGEVLLVSSHTYRLSGDIVRQPSRALRFDPLIGVPGIRADMMSVALPSHQPGQPEPGLAEQQEAR